MTVEKLRNALMRLPADMEVMVNMTAEGMDVFKLVSVVEIDKATTADDLEVCLLLGAGDPILETEEKVKES